MLAHHIVTLGTVPADLVDSWQLYTCVDQTVSTLFWKWFLAWLEIDSLDRGLKFNSYICRELKPFHCRYENHTVRFSTLVKMSTLISFQMWTPE